MTIDISQAKTPSLLRRLGAMFYDSVLLLGVLMVANAIIVIPYEVIVGSPVYEHFLPLTLMRLYLLAVVAIFFVYFWTRGGQTLGMRAWRLRVVTEAGEPLGTLDAIKRFGWAIPSVLGLGFGVWMSLFNADRLAWHDRKSGSRLVMVKKPEGKTS